MESDKNLTIGFVFHHAKRNNNEVILSFVNAASEKGFICAAYSDSVHGIDFPFHKLEFCHIDFVVALGGDGSVLAASSLAAERNVPLLGVNNGRIGFLTELEISDFENALDKIAEGDYTLDQKMILKCSTSVAEYTSLNDFTVYKKAFAEVVNLSISINGIDAGNVFCDGVVISTPTGATAYSISAGGPLIAPGLDCILVTPICPHSLCFRPIVASADSIIRIHTHSDCVLACAGDSVANIGAESIITMAKAPFTCSFMIMTQHNIYSLVRERLT